MPLRGNSSGGGVDILSVVRAASSFEPRAAAEPARESRFEPARGGEPAREKVPERAREKAASGPLEAKREPPAPQRVAAARERAQAEERLLAADVGRRLDPRPTTLKTEVLGDGEANCLELAATTARDHHELVFMDDRRSAEQGNPDGAGHVLIRDPGSGRVWDPNDGPPLSNVRAWPHASAEAWAAEQGVGRDRGPAYAEVGAAPASTVREVLSLDPEARAERIAAEPGLAAIASMAVADQDPIDGQLGAAGAGLALPSFTNVVTGQHGTAAETALRILETMTDGRPAFRPELGLGGVQWFVTEGQPHVGRGAQNPVTIPVDIEAPRGTIEFREADLTRIFDRQMEGARTLAEQQYRTRNGVAADAPLSRRAQNIIARNANAIAERAMWQEVGEQVARSQSGVGRVHLENSRFSRSGNGQFMLTSRPSAVQIRGGAAALVDVIQRTGQPVERPVLEAAERLATEQRWQGRVQGAFRVGGRVLVIAGLAADGYRIYQAEDRLREGAIVAGGWAGATGAGGVAAAKAAPLLAAGPWGWAGYGLITVGAGAIGYFAGEAAAEALYDLVVTRPPIDVPAGR